jgi:hypothetical protein
MQKHRVVPGGRLGMPFMPLIGIATFGGPGGGEGGPGMVADRRPLGSDSAGGEGGNGGEAGRRGGGNGGEGGVCRGVSSQMLA